MTFSLTPVNFGDVYRCERNCSVFLSEHGPFCHSDSVKTAIYQDRSPERTWNLSWNLTRKWHRTRGTRGTFINKTRDGRKRKSRRNDRARHDSRRRFLNCNRWFKTRVILARGYLYVADTWRGNDKEFMNGLWDVPTRVSARLSGVSPIISARGCLPRNNIVPPDFTRINDRDR